MPGPVEVKITPHHQGPVEARRAPRLREFFGIGWHGTDVRNYLLDFKNKLLEPQSLIGSTQIFGKLTELFFAASPLNAKFKITDAAIYTAEKELGFGIPLERRITPEVIDRVLEKITVSERYCYDEVLSLIIKEAKLTKPAEVDPFLLGRIDTMDLKPQIESLLERDVLTEPEKNLLRTMLELGMTAQLESLIKDIAKTELKSPEQLKCLEKILRGLIELRLPMSHLEAMLKMSPDYLLRQAYIIGTLRMYAESGSLPLSAAQWSVLLSSLQTLFTASSSAMPRLNTMENMRLLILGIAGLGLSASQIHTLLSEGMTKPIESNFIDLIKTGEKVDSLLNSLNTTGTGLDKFLSEYGKNDESTKIMDNTLPAADPLRATENLMNSLVVDGKNVDPAAKLINDLVNRTEDREDREEMLDSLVIVMERSDIKNDDPRMELARKVISTSSEGLGLLLLSHIGLQRDAIIAAIPVIGYLSAAKPTMNRIENELSAMLAKGLSREGANRLLEVLRDQVGLGQLYISNKMIQNLASALELVRSADTEIFFSYYYDLISNQFVDSSPMILNDILQRSAFILSLQIMNVDKSLDRQDLESAQKYAEMALAYANQNGLRAAIVRYLPGFLSATIEGKVSEKQIDDLRIAVRTDKGRGLFIALDLVQEVLRDEVYTELEHIIRKLAPYELPPRLAVLGKIVQMEKLAERENRMQLAIELVKQMEQDVFWFEVLDLMATQQYEELNTRVSKWVMQNYLSN